MSQNIVSISIDHQGNLKVDFSGFVGRSCEFEETEIRRILTEMGLKLTPDQFRSKVASNTAPASFQTKDKQQVTI